MFRPKTVLLFINGKSLIIALLAILSTFLCRSMGWTADFPLTLIATAIVFPIVFSINSAYKRREAALKEYGSLKAHGRAIFWAVRDWPENMDAALLEKTKSYLHGFLKASKQFFREPLSADAKESKSEAAVYEKLSQLSLTIKEMRKRGVSSGEVSRCNQYLSKMAVSFENLKHIYQYRTPRTLRAFSHFFIILLPIFYGPYFASISLKYAQGLEYLMPILFSTIFVSLDNIQDQLENPFDQVGEDDINIHEEKFAAQLIE